MKIPAGISEHNKLSAHMRFKFPSNDYNADANELSRMRYMEVTRKKKRGGEQIIKHRFKDATTGALFQDMNAKQTRELEKLLNKEF